MNSNLPGFYKVVVNTCPCLTPFSDATASSLPSPRNEIISLRIDEWDYDESVLSFDSTDDFARGRGGNDKTR